MIDLVRTLCLFGACCYAARNSWRHPALFLYFASQILYTVAVEATLRAVGDTSRAYTVVYLSFTVLVLLAALGIVWEALLPYTYKLRRLSLFALSAVVLTRFVEIGIHRPLHLSDWVVLLEGGVLYMAGFTLVCISFFSGKKADAYFILSILWMCQAGFFWAYLLGLPEAVWIEAGYFVPTAFVVAGFLLVGRRLRQLGNSRP